jgi:hypothetical protein
MKFGFGWQILFWLVGLVYGLASGKNKKIKGERVMATKKKGILTSAPQWWDHLKDWKKVFWSAERKAAKREIKKELRNG